jgi:D-alanyl-D-alanine carboxypeptidase
LIETLTGTNFSAVLEDQILQPLKLASTAYLSGTRLPRPAALGYQGYPDDGQPDNVVINASALGSSGAMATTLHDLAAWGRALAVGFLLPHELQGAVDVCRSDKPDL